MVTIYKIIVVYLISVVLPLLVIGKQKETLKLEGDYYPLVYISFFPFVNSVFLAILIVSYVCFKLSDFISFLESDRKDKRKLFKDLNSYVEKQKVYGHTTLDLDDFFVTGGLTVYEDGEVLISDVKVNKSLNRRQGKRLFRKMKKVFKEQQGFFDEVKLKREIEAIEKFYNERINGE